MTGWPNPVCFVRLDRRVNHGLPPRSTTSRVAVTLVAGFFMLATTAFAQTEGEQTSALTSDGKWVRGVYCRVNGRMLAFPVETAPCLKRNTPTTPVRSTASVSGRTDAIDLAIAQYVTTGKIDPAVGNLAAAQGGFAAGAALSAWIERSASGARARAIAEQQAREREEQRRALERERTRNETWASLSTQLKLSTQPTLALRITNAGRSLDLGSLKIGDSSGSSRPQPLGLGGMKIGGTYAGDTAAYAGKEDTSADDLLRGRPRDCTFGICRERRGNYVETPVDLRRGVFLARQTVYASPAHADVLWDQAMNAASGDGTLQVIAIPDDVPAIDEAALRRFQDASRGYRGASDAHVDARLKLDQALQRRTVTDELVRAAERDLAAASRTDVAARRALLAQMYERQRSSRAALEQAQALLREAESGVTRNRERTREQIGLLAFPRGTVATTRQAGVADAVDLRSVPESRLVVDPRILSNNPSVQREQAELDRDPDAWYRGAQSRVAAANHGQWTNLLMLALREGESSNAFRYMRWATSPGDDPALDAALTGAVRRAYPGIDPNANPRVLREIAWQHISPFLLARPSQPLVFDPDGDLLADFLDDFQRMPTPRIANSTSPGDPAVPTWARDLLEVFQRPPSSRTPPDKLLLDGILQRINVEGAMAPHVHMPLANLKPGDVLVVAPPSARRDLAGAAVGRVVQVSDYIVRVATAFAEHGLAGAARTQLENASHTLAYVGTRDGRMLFLDHTAEAGSRIVDSREILVRYGAREMLVAHPLMPVDADALWTIARERREFGVGTSDRVLGSRRIGWAIVKATGTLLHNNRLGPIDITPGDFLDPRNNVGKHFVVMPLRITGVPRKSDLP